MTTASTRRCSGPSKSNRCSGTPPADFLEGTRVHRDRHPVSDFFTQGQKIEGSPPWIPLKPLVNDFLTT
jgi:hypothetical protein